MGPKGRHRLISAFCSISNSEIWHEGQLADCGFDELLSLLQDTDSRCINQRLAFLSRGFDRPQPFFAKPPSKAQFSEWTQNLQLARPGFDKPNRKPSPPGYYGFFPSTKAREALASLKENSFSFLGEEGWSITALVLSNPLPYNMFGEDEGASGKGPHAKISLGKSRDNYLPIETDGDAAALYWLITKKVHPQLSGLMTARMSSLYEDSFPKLP